MKLSETKLFAVALAALVLSACASQGAGGLKDETNATLQTKIETGVTSKQDIFAMLGSPTNTSFTDSGLEILTYRYTKLTPRARNFIPYNVISQVNDEHRKELVILLADSGVVRKFVLNEIATESRWGVAE